MVAYTRGKIVQHFNKAPLIITSHASNRVAHFFLILVYAYALLYLAYAYIRVKLSRTGLCFVIHFVMETNPCKFDSPCESDHKIGTNKLHLINLINSVLSEKKKGLQHVRHNPHS